MSKTITYVLNVGSELLGKKWRAVVIFYLKDGPLRFSQIRNHVPSISVKVLSEVLKEMEDNKLVVRKQYNTIPVKVTYELSPSAQQMANHNLQVSKTLGKFILDNHAAFNVPKEVVNDLETWLVASDQDPH